MLHHMSRVWLRLVYVSLWVAAVLAVTPDGRRDRISRAATTLERMERK